MNSVDEEFGDGKRGPELTPRALPHIEPGHRVYDLRRVMRGEHRFGWVAALMDDYVVADFYEAGEYERCRIPWDFVALESWRQDEHEYSNGDGGFEDQDDLPDDYHVIDVQLRMLRASIRDRIGEDHPEAVERMARAFEPVFDELERLSRAERQRLIDERDVSTGSEREVTRG